MNSYTIELNGSTVEFVDGLHLYVVDGKILPSITQILGVKFGRKYDGVDRAVLQRAADAGTAVHEAIEAYCRDGELRDLPEVRNFRFLQRAYKFEVLENEVPVVLFRDDEPIACGRLDMVLKMDGKIGGADIKRVSVLDKEYLAYQLNLYRIAYRQCYGMEWEFLRAIHLREEVRKFVEIPIKEAMAWGIVDEFERSKNE